MTDTGLMKRAVADKLRDEKNPQRVMLGFDGFIDEIIHVVGERTDKDNYTRIPTIAGLAERIAGLAGLSGSFELVNKQTKLGGNGPIMANAMIGQGHKVTYVGTIGSDEIHPLFRDFSERCEHVLSVCEPAHTDALEFNDGKVMLGKATELDALDWDLLSTLAEPGELKDIASTSALLAFTNWTAIYGMNSIISGFTSLIKEAGNEPYVFFDLADPSKRTREDVLGLFTLIAETGSCSKVIFGMNEHESDILAPMLGITESDLKERASKIRSVLGLHMAVIHPVRGAAVADADGSYWVDGPYVEHPVLTTGAGDNFNAGFCHGVLMGLSPAECLVTGVSTSGFYVRYGHSPSVNELEEFIRKWAAY